MHQTRACAEMHKDTEKMLPLLISMLLGKTIHGMKECMKKKKKECTRQLKIVPNCGIGVSLLCAVLHNDLEARSSGGYFLSAHGFHHICDTGQQPGTYG